MEYRIHPKTGDSISVLGIGTAYIAEADEKDAVAALVFAQEQGFNYADLATAGAKTFGYFGTAFSGTMPDNIWKAWYDELKKKLTAALGYAIGEPEDGYDFICGNYIRCPASGNMRAAAKARGAPPTVRAVPHVHTFCLIRQAGQAAPQYEARVPRHQVLSARFPAA